ncbi:MAG: UDP-glucose--hexose-1-phosphate uridylyltransferase [Sphaerochaetaceae bacterium]|nr:UDP-glucose--hexose-1-phosphate uridylyltransferase [Sphaerochaetaceae bacterium]
MNLQDHTHNRYNPLLGEWIKVSPHRTKRPWQGQVEKPQVDQRPQYDPSCYLCPGNKRADGTTNPAYDSTYVFTNDFSAILPDTPSDEYEEGPNGLLRAKGEKGICRVVCFSPRHDLTLARMDASAIENVVRVWQNQYRDLGAKSFINHIQIFENRGAMMGCSNPHPHGQIWGEEIIPDIPRKELENQCEYMLRHGSPMLLDYARYELEQKVRIVVMNEHFVGLVPFWAVWPYETMILPARRAVASIDELTDEEVAAMADIIRRLGIKYDNLFSTSFPYSMGIHQKPTDGGEYQGCVMHFHYYPPLLRSATVKKFMVGYEMMGMPQRDITAEGSAKNLRELSEIHYMDML